jgi:hypothetical protein
MGRSKLRGMTSDDIWKRWAERVNAIHVELAFVFANRRKFLEVQQMFQKNELLSQIGSQPYQWILGHWGRADRQALNKAAKPVLDYGNQLIAHRTPIGRLPLSINQIHDALDTIEPVFKKYFVILTGSVLSEIEPTNVGDDWKETFKFPWYVGPIE